MQWYDYLMVFLGGAFVANFVPHFVRGITGQPFPTPFAKPPGRGPSPPALNVAWGLANLVVGYLLLSGGRFSWADPTAAAIASGPPALMSETTPPGTIWSIISR